MAQTTPKACRALLPDQSTPCTKTVKDERPYCWQHGKEYASLTREYKALSAQNEELDPGKLTWNDIRVMGKADVGQAVRANEMYMVCLGAEIQARTTHHMRFFGEVDLGHGGWLALLRGKRQRASAQLDLLDKASVTTGAHRKIGNVSGGFRLVQPIRRTGQEASVPDRGVDLFITVPCVITFGLLLWSLPRGAWAMLWACARIVLSLLSIILQCFHALAIQTIRALWSLAVVLCTMCWRIAILELDGYE